jgi:tetratricopeptide (TPR) repeat protein
MSAIAHGKALIVCGAGVTRMATDNSAPGWKALIEAGLSHCRKPVADRDLLDSCQKLIGSANAANWLRAADDIQEMLGGKEGGDYRAFLKSSLGSLKATTPEIVDAVKALHRHGNRIATTNYDDILRHGLTCDAIPWTARELFAECLNSERVGVLHIHGWWGEPKSVVFSRRDYAAIGSEEATQFLQKLSSHNFTLVFVGCSTAGLADENVGELMRWFNQHWSGLGQKHFVLVREAEVADPEWPKAVTPVSYGSKYDELPGFLASLAPTEPASSAGLLPPPPNMIGRRDQLRQLVDYILTDKLPIVVPGGPGMGKTTLAVAAAYEPKVEARFGPRRHFVNLEAVTSADAMVRAVATALGGKPTGSLDDARALIAAAAAPAPTLVILDNTETPWHADRNATEDQFARLGAIPGLTAVITHRGDNPSIVSGKRQLPDIRKLPPDEAKALFVREAGGLFADDPDLDALVAELDGHPLSIVLVAAEADGRPTLVELLSDWQERKADLLRRGTGDNRLTSVRVSLELSLARLEARPDAKRLLGLVALLPAGLDKQHIPTILPDAQSRPERVLQQARLVDVVANRLTMLAPLRETASQLCLARPEDEDRHVDLILGMAADGGKAGRQDWQTVRERIEREEANLDAAVRLGTAKSRIETLARAAVGLAAYASFTGRASISAIEPAARGLLAKGHYREAADCIRSLGDIAFRRSDHDTARTFFEQARPLYVRVGSVVGEANCIRSLGDIALRRSDHDTARTFFEQARPLYVRVGGVLGEANCIHSLGNIALARSDPDTAQTLFEQARPLYVRVGDVLGEANCIYSLGNIALRRSDHDTARTFFEQARPLYVRVGSVVGEANCIRSLGDIALRRFDHDTARTRYDEARPLYVRVGDVLGEANCIHSLGNIALARSDPDTAKKRYDEARYIYVRIGDVLGEANCVHSLGDIALARSDPDTAQTLFEQARPLYVRVGSVVGEANCTKSLGDIAFRRSDHDTARTRYEEALSLYERIPEPYSIGLTLARLALIAPDDATRTRHRAAAEAAWRSIGRQDLIDEHLK